MYHEYDEQNRLAEFMREEEEQTAIIWEAKITAEMVEGMDAEMVEQLIDELNDAVAAIFEEYQESE